MWQSSKAPSLLQVRKKVTYGWLRSVKCENLNSRCMRNWRVMSNEIPRLFGCVGKSKNKGKCCQKKNYSSPWSYIWEILKLSSDPQVCFTISTQVPPSIVYSWAKNTNYLNFHVKKFAACELFSRLSVCQLEKDLDTSVNPSIDSVLARPFPPGYIWIICECSCKLRNNCWSFSFVYKWTKQFIVIEINVLIYKFSNLPFFQPS